MLSQYMVSQASAVGLVNNRAPWVHLFCCCSQPQQWSHNSTKMSAVWSRAKPRTWGAESYKIRLESWRLRDGWKVFWFPRQQKVVQTNNPSPLFSLELCLGTPAHGRGDEGIFSGESRVNGVPFCLSEWYCYSCLPTLQISIIKLWIASRPQRLKNAIVLQRGSGVWSLTPV